MRSKEHSIKDGESFGGHYRGVVVDNQDPLQGGRCRVRVFSVYDDVPDNIIPWAEYADPFMQGTSGTGGSFIPDIGMKVWVFFENGDHMQPVYFAGAPAVNDGPPNRTATTDDVPRYGIQYSQNRAIRTPSGHLIEMDDTEGDSRLRIHHKSGSQYVFYENGDVTEIVVGNYKRFVTGNIEEYISGDVLRMVNGNEIYSLTGNYTSVISGTFKTGISGAASHSYGSDLVVTVNGTSAYGVVGDNTLTVGGGLTLQSTGTANMWSSASIVIDAPNTALNPTASPAIQPAQNAPAEDFIISNEFQLTPQNASLLIDLAGPKAAFDEESESVPAGWPAEETNEPVLAPREINDVPTPNAPLNPECEVITSVDYSYRVSASYTLKDLSTGAVFPHPIKAQVGLSLSEIVCNLKNLAVNILEPLKAQYPAIRINSCFRVGNGSSQHNKGQAVDIQIPGGSPALYSEMAAWIVKNLPFDQFILEHGKSVWLHISYSSSSQRGMKGTYWPRGTPQYEWGVLKNYYDSKRVIV